MRYFCGECGEEIPEDMEFCPVCGSYREKAVITDDSGSRLTGCPSCGAPFRSGDTYCASCGKNLGNVNASPPVTMEMQKRGIIAIILALGPGFFNIFGLGHIYLKQYSRGVMFLGISLVLWYLNGWQMFADVFLLRMVDIMMFFYQGMDVMSYINDPEVR